MNYEIKIINEFTQHERPKLFTIPRPHVSYHSVIDLLYLSPFVSSSHLTKSPAEYDTLIYFPDIIIINYLIYN